MSEDVTNTADLSEEISEDVTADETYIDTDVMSDDDVLATLLSATAVRQTTRIELPATAYMGKTQYVLRALLDTEITNLQKQAERPKPGSKTGERELDNSLYNRLLVVKAIVSPDLTNKDILHAHGVVSAERLIEKLWLSGWVPQVAAKVLKLSGWDEEAIKTVGES